MVYQWKIAYQYKCHLPKCYQKCPYQVWIPIRRFVICYFVLINTLSVDVFLSVILGTYKYAHQKEHQKLGGHPNFYQNRRWGFWEIAFLKTSGHPTPQSKVLSPGNIPTHTRRMLGSFQFRSKVLIPSKPAFFKRVIFSSSQSNKPYLVSISTIGDESAWLWNSSC